MGAPIQLFIAGACESICCCEVAHPDATAHTAKTATIFSISVLLVGYWSFALKAEEILISVNGVTILSRDQRASGWSTATRMCSKTMALMTTFGRKRTVA